MRHRLFLTLSGLFFLIPLIGQQTMLFSVDYMTNNNVVQNINSTVKQPALSPAVSFMSSWGIDATAMSSFIANSDDSLKNFSTETDFVLGYTWKISEHFSIYPSYTRFVFSRNSNAFNTMFRRDWRVDADYHNRIVSAGLTSGYLSGQQHTLYAMARNYYMITLNKFLFRNAVLSIMPEADLNFGNYEYLNLYYIEQLENYSGFYNYMLVYSKSLRRYVISEMIRHPGKNGKEIINEYLENKAQDSFKLTGLSLSLPVTYTIGNFGINAGLYIMLPMNQPDYLSGDPLVYFDAGVSYSFDF
ncbi:MAG TPA: hypothetical protein VK179_06200 [Bacteroidales bacterium]|nr:hypothetical protein [Bacteroidales bacterium]